MDRGENPMLSNIEAIDDRTIEPYELLQVHLNEAAEAGHSGYIMTPHLPFHTTHHHHHPHHLSGALSGATLHKPIPVEWPFFNHHHFIEPSPSTSIDMTTNSSSLKSEPTVDKASPPVTVEPQQHHHGGDKRSKRTIMQRIRRINESPEEIALRRQKNRELNRQRREKLNKSGITTEKSRNRLRQRVKREITRMLRTGEKRDDFIVETFSDVQKFFSADEYNSMLKQINDTIALIEKRKKS